MASPLCGAKIQATACESLILGNILRSSLSQLAGKTSRLLYKASAAGCAQFDLDMSPAAFDQLADVTP
ncbi:hypothetical protein JB92DRAFT_2863187 [Gautieria morchelliformis]|nr:hypothetical protein JB92DRAFT_2863182 [Gautieria morchelliformis]KAF8528573.1 hypothetical protein JB92DRAFT_2863187 [Gautieria morchelliformis]